MIDSELIKFLPQEAQSRMRELERLYESEGYKLFKSWVAQNYGQAQEAVMMAKSWPDNRVAMGRVTAFGDILNLEERTAQEFTQQALAAQEEQEQDIIDGELDYE